MNVYTLINPPVKALLRSPLHGLMSGNTLLLEFTGRKSGRALSTPISYYLKDDAAHCFTSRTFGWWRNLVDNRTVSLTIRGRRFETVPIVEAADLKALARALDSFLRAVPRDARPSGVALEEDGTPNQADIERVVPQMVYLRFPLQPSMEPIHG